MEIWFYHLDAQPLERALPKLVEKAVERGWRVVVQAPDERAVKAVDDLLWSFAPESFLPHATAGDAHAERQPVLVTCDGANPNGAAARFFVAGAEVDLAPDAGYDRVILLFDGRSEDALGAARRQWSRLKGQGFTLAYWQQDGAGWSRRA